MKSALNYAKYFIKKGLDTNPNTYDGNMKLQKMLFFANYISLVTNGEGLFPEKIRAFSNGCVVEEVRLRYRNDYYSLYDDSKNYDPDMTQSEYDILNMTIDIFGDLSARELSDLNHTFDFWNTAYKRSEGKCGYDKEKAIVSTAEMLAESEKLKDVIEAFKQTKTSGFMKEIINGITFYYDPSVNMDDETVERLVAFSKEAEDSSYTVYTEEGSLVIY